MARKRAILIWAAVLAAVIAPLAIAATSPLLQWRQPVYIAAGFAGIAAMGLLLVQPLLAAGHLPGLTGRLGRRLHGWIGGGLVALVLAHVLGLWLTSPPDVIDALLFRSPTPFSVWGVTAMWAAIAAAAVAAVRTRLGLRPRVWRLIHASLTATVVIGSVVHAMMIEGTMGIVSKTLLCVLVLAVAAKVLFDLVAPILAARRRA